MKRKNKLKGLTMSVVALGAISVVPIITTSCSKEEEPVDYSNEEITDEQYQEQVDTIADIKDAIAAIENGTYDRTLSEVVNKIKSYEYFDVVINIDNDMYIDDYTYDDSYLSGLKTNIYEPFENKNILLSYDQFCILIDLELETEENTLQDEDLNAYGISANISLIAFLDNKENLLLLPYLDDNGGKIDGTYDGNLYDFVRECIGGLDVFGYEPDESWNFISYFSNYYELAEKLLDSMYW